MPSLANIWTYVGPLMGAILGFVGSYLLERRRESRKKREKLQIIECVELVNAKVLDEQSLGPIASDIQIKAPKAGPGSEIIEIREIYFARYRLRNLSDAPISRFLVSSRSGPNSIWFSVTEGDKQSGPDWEQRFRALLEETREPGSKSSFAYPIPYLNPYSSSGHEVFLDLSSYLPLSGIEIVGGAEGVSFVFKKVSST